VYVDLDVDRRVVEERDELRRKLQRSERKLEKSQKDLLVLATKRRKQQQAQTTLLDDDAAPSSDKQQKQLTAEIKSLARTNFLLQARSNWATKSLWELRQRINFDHDAKILQRERDIRQQETATAVQTDLFFWGVLQFATYGWLELIEFAVASGYGDSDDFLYRVPFQLGIQYWAWIVCLLPHFSQRKG